MNPVVLGVSHLSLTVRHRAAAQRFWVDVFGFEVVEDNEEFCFVLERAAGVALILTDHGGSAVGPFDERNVGLDHLALAVPEEATLLTWEQRLTQLGVPHSATTETDGGLHLNLRAPDDLAVELFVMKPTLAEALDLGDRLPVASTHR